MELKTYYKADGKEYAKSYGTEKAVNADDKTATIDGVVYKLRHARAPKVAPAEDQIAPEPKKAKKKTYRRKK